MTARDTAGLHLRRDGAGGPVLLLHSLFFDGEMFDDLVRALVAAGFEATFLRPDHRGQGRSDDGPLGLSDLADDAAALLVLHADGPAHVVGSSMGGYVATHLAARRPDLVKSLALLGGTADAEPEPERFAALEHAVRDRGAGLVDLLEHTMFGDRHLTRPRTDSARRRWREQFATLEPRVADAAHEVFHRDTLSPLYDLVAVPVLLIAGESDHAKPPEHMQRMARPGARLVVLAGVGHTPAVEVPGDVARLLLEHWSATPPAPDPQTASYQPQHAQEEEHVSTPLPRASSAVELSTTPFEDLVPRAGDVAGDGDAARLMGSVCQTCGSKNFPRRMACLACGGTDLGATTLANEGVLYSHTTVHVSSSRETPYHLAYIDLADGVRVLGAVSGAAIAAGIDRPVSLATDAAGAWWFEPAAASVHGASA